MFFTKLVSSILTSSIWTEDDHTRLVWITMLALADREGYVGASIPGLASVARVPIESAAAAIKKFLSPDPYSRSTAFGGRRIEEAIGGWLILNYAEYRRRSTAKDRVEYKREYQREYMRDVRQTCSNNVQHVSNSLVSCIKKEGSMAVKEGMQGEGDVVSQPPDPDFSNPPPDPSPKKRHHKAPAKMGDEQFERCWAKYRRIGAKWKALEYWKKIPQEDRDAIEDTIPRYMKCVDVGRYQKQFEGWINPANRLWDQDWENTHAMITTRNRPSSRRVGGTPDFSDASNDPLVRAALENNKKLMGG